MVFFLFVLLSDEPEVFLPKYSQTAILQAAHFRRVVNHCITSMIVDLGKNGISTERSYLIMVPVFQPCTGPAGAVQWD